jgi:pyridoxamine 5'-phosphate oxidase-like protein
VGRSFESLSPALADAVQSAPLFFVATAPLAADGHVNLSPKGGDTLRVLDERTVAYLDLTGSGIETIAHLRENGRITLMVCAFSGPPQIIRLYGRGEVLRRGDEGYDELADLFPDLPGARAVIRVALERVGSSCGYAVPFMRYEGERSRLDEWAEARGPEGLVEYRATKNAVSIDGLPGLDPERVFR